MIINFSEIGEDSGFVTVIASATLFPALGAEKKLLLRLAASLRYALTVMPASSPDPTILPSQF